MSLPKQPLEIDADRQALAPYNFVELPERIAAVIAGDSLPKINKAATKAERETTLVERNKLVTAQLPDQNTFHETRHSGWIDCLLTTESPAYVRAPRSEDEARRGIQSKDLPAFFYEWEQNEPVIPGSTLRGMLRSLVEIASYGKVTEVTDKRLIYRAVGDTTNHGTKYREQLMLNETKEYARGNRNQQYHTPLMLGGYMRKRGSDWFIQPAEVRDGTTFARIRLDERFFNQLAKVPGCRNASKVYVRVGPYDFQPVRGGFLNIRASRVLESSGRPDAPKLFEATLVRSGYMFSKRSEAVIYPPDEKADWLSLDDEQIDDYRNQVSAEQEKLLGKGGVLREGQPVFYTLVRNDKDEPLKDKNGKLQVSFFGHCRMLRLPYKQSPRDFVPPNVRREEDVDLAEAIFGFTKKMDSESYSPKERRYAGRVKISSAKLVAPSENIWLSRTPITPQVLGSPKPTTFQHYLVQSDPNAIVGGYFKGGRPMDDYASLSSITTLRGSKLYWHKSGVTASAIEVQGRSKENVSTQIRPVRAGVQFSFRLQFDNLSNVELGALLWVLQIGADENYRLKLGMGKPLGMGAVKATSTLYLINRVARYSTLFEQEIVANQEGKEEVKIKWEPGQAVNPISEIELQTIQAFETFVTQRVRTETASPAKPKKQSAPPPSGFGNSIRGLSALNIEPLAETKAPESPAESFAELDRIQQLLAMLRWPGPDPTETRYLEIERYDPAAKRGKRNEYDTRPVLPSPLALKQREPLKPKAPKGDTPTVVPPQEKKDKPQEKEKKDEYLKTGTIKVWGLGAKKAYGFIKQDESDSDAFVHRSNLIDITELRSQDRVQYRLRTKEFGVEAIEVRIIDELSEGENESYSN